MSKFIGGGSMNKSYYAIIPANFRYDEELPPNTKLLYGEITALANERGYCWASNEYFATLYKVNKKTISNWVSLLVKKGYIHSQIIYKESTKAVAERRLFIHPPIHEKMEGWEGNHGEGGKEKMDTPIHEIMEDNNTEFNNTFNNTDYLSSSLCISNNQGNTSERKVKQDDDKKIVFDFYQQNFGMLSPYIIQQLDYWIEDLNPEVVRLALEKSLMNNVRNFNYTNRVLNDWKSKNVKTIEDVRSLDLEYSSKKPVKRQRENTEKVDYGFKTTRY